MGKFFSSKLNKFNFVHVHGIWSLLQILTVLFCINKKTNVFVHPHGMLLHDALKSGGWIKYILKLISLGILSFFFQRVNFIAITNQEKEAIRYFFKKSKIFLIENPIPFKKFENLKTDKKEKKIVYFGRIHPHKNLNLLIDSFIEANLTLIGNYSYMEFLMMKIIYLN